MVAIKQQFPRQTDGTLDLQAWLSRINVTSMDPIKNAAELAFQSSKGLTTFYGQPCIEQGLAIAEILLELQLDKEAIAAAILLSANISEDILTKHFNPTIVKLVRCVTQMETITSHNKNRNELQINKLRKMMLAMASDIRVVLIKLAEKTCILRGIKHINTLERKRIAEETLNVYAPLANSLGIGQLKWELEDLSFYYIDNEQYRMIAHYLDERRANRQQRIEAIIADLKKQFSSTGIQMEITGRAKHIYSIFLKMQKKHVDYKKIYDTSAIRILVPTLEDCYNVLSIVHRLWEHIPEEFDDYIAHPKPNGYQSIHTAIIGPDEKTLEIQIRTYDMHNEAEHGVAAHWIYKDTSKEKSQHEKISLLRQLFSWQKDIAQQNLFDDTVYVLTPAGDIIDLTQGATPLDFAYHIHTDLGHRCRGAKINGHIVPLTYHLKTGEKVEIITTPNGTPSRDWLNKEAGYLKTSRAKSKVLQWFRQQDVTHIKPAPVVQGVTKEPHSKPPNAISSDNKSEFCVSGMNDLLTRIARCCKPIPGDTIIGYITQGRGVSVHRNDCHNMTSIKETQQNRLIHVSWDNKSLSHFYVDLLIRASAKTQVLKEITSILANTKIAIVQMNSSISKKSTLLIITMTIEIQNKEQLTKLIADINKLPSVQYVGRMH